MRCRSITVTERSNSRASSHGVAPAAGFKLCNGHLRFSALAAGISKNRSRRVALRGRFLRNNAGRFRTVLP